MDLGSFPIRKILINVFKRLIKEVQRKELKVGLDSF